MELKPYQQQVLDDLALYLDYVQQNKNVAGAYQDFWNNHLRTPLAPAFGKAIEPYKENVPAVPHVCVKVPTAGGKTFIACNALRVIFNAFDLDKTRAVIWLVPSNAILEQTLRSLRDKDHPYRQKINVHFQNRVEVYDKDALLNGASFNATAVQEQLSIFVLSFDSLRTRNKEGRKIYQENGNFLSFVQALTDRSHLLEGADETALINVLRQLNPVVVVDESHNAETELSVDMLRNLNPSFILDLTATPRRNSNILSFVDALELKKENMVKLPVIVYNHPDKNDVISSALQLQKVLEQQANDEYKKTGRYIRPIVLFQAQPKNDEDNTTFEKLKKKLIELQIPEEQIKIKTATLNEIKGIDLMSRECQVRFIITINALKEGWDCPFAYILASLADKSSSVDVEQILGRVLRQPHVRKHEQPLLNLSYVFTASGKFLDTLSNIVRGLNKAGFSERDYKLANTETTPAPVEQLNLVFESLLSSTDTEAVGSTPASELFADIDTDKIIATLQQPQVASLMGELEKMAVAQNQQFERTILEMEKTKETTIPQELKSVVKTFGIKEVFAPQAETIKLPQFFMNIPSSDIFGSGERDILLDKNNLLEGFQLSKGDASIAFETVASELYKVDLDETTRDTTPTFVKIDGHIRESLLTYILDPAKREDRIKNATKRLKSIIGNLAPIADKEIERYINKVLEGFSDEQFNYLAELEHSYANKIKDKIRRLSEQHAEKRFNDFLDTDRISLKEKYVFAPTITPKATSLEIIKSLYEKEEGMNGFEEQVINEIANLPNVAFWTRNLERKGFHINGYLNHYPDFIVVTKGGKIIVVETKGDDRDNSDSEAKIRLGRKWASKAGNNYRYFMVFDEREVRDAYNLDRFLEVMKAIT